MHERISQDVGRARTWRLTSPRRAFTLMEVLIALGIFAIGLVAIAAIFPTAIAVQRETIEDLVSQRVSKNAQEKIFALARAKVLSYNSTGAGTAGTLDDYVNNNSGGANASFGVREIYPLVNIPLESTGLPQPTNWWSKSANSDELDPAFPLSLLSYPSNKFDDPASPTYTHRTYYWYPFIRPMQALGSSDPPTWQAYVMVLHSNGNGNYPEPRAVEVKVDGSERITFVPKPGGNGWNDANNNGVLDWIQPGDTVMLSRGPQPVLKVVLADADGFSVASPVMDPGVGVNGHPLMLYYGRYVGDNTNAADDDQGREKPSPMVRIDEFDIQVPEP